MKLRILASGSAGNCCVLDNGKDALVIEAGVKMQEVKQALDFDISRVNGCIVSHEHLDHSGYMNDFLKARIPVYASAGTIEAVKGKMKINDYSLSMLRTLAKGKSHAIGSFKVIPFDVQHDCADPLGFLIQHPDMGVALFATDTYYLKYRFQGLNQILIECNYRDDILTENIREGRIPGLLLQRTLQSHMSYDTCLSTLKANDLTEVHNIVLIHLSDGNSNALEFEEGIREATGKAVHVAKKGMTINFGKTPF